MKPSSWASHLNLHHNVTLNTLVLKSELYLQQPTGTSKASAKRDVRSALLNSCKHHAILLNSATLIQLVSVLIFMTVDKRFPSHTGNLVYSKARFATLE